jgi:C-terminal processing protease CtpA/Prc
MEHKKILLAIISILFLLSINACRDSDDSFYDYFDNLTARDTTYVGQFKAIWSFLDCKYPMWDYEESLGLNWDEVYKKYLPKFEELDKRDRIVEGDELKDLYSEVLMPLHDGHMFLRIYNTDTLHIAGQVLTRHRDVVINPQLLKNEKSRVDYGNSLKKNSKTDSLNSYKSQIKEIHTNDSITDFYCVFSDDIVYYELSPNDTNMYYNMFWKELYAEIKKMHSNNSLKGIIIDLRSFNGGNTKYLHHIIGFLQPINFISGYHRVGYTRFKSGIGRYDYTPKTPQLYHASSNYQLNITNMPIIVLSSCKTASLGEIVCLAAQSLNNGYVIGMRTYGAFSVENTFKATKSPINIGDAAGIKTIYMNVPNGTFFNDEGEILDGKGVTPDIEVQLDVDEYEATGRDTQLERALEFIRTGK